MIKPSLNSFNTQQTLTVNNKDYEYFSLPTLEANGIVQTKRLPKTLKILLENLLRFEDDEAVKQGDIKAMQDWLTNKSSDHEIAYNPTRVLMQDFTGVPAIVDLAAMRDAIVKLEGSPDKINPLTPVDLVIDHSVQVDEFANKGAYEANVKMEMKRNLERYQFLRWGQEAFDNFRVVPPGTGICHQVNLEYLAKTVWDKTVDGKAYAFPDTLVGTDSHTTMVNGIGVLGWGVGGIEAEAAMLGQPVSMLIPDVIGFELKGKLPEGITATDLVLTITERLRQRGVVGKFVEFFGDGLANLPLADRATVSNMSPEFGATCAFFPVDDKTLDYMRLTARDEQTIALTEAYCKAQGLWHDSSEPVADYTDTMTLDMSTVAPCVAGPKRPQDRVTLEALPDTFDQMLSEAGRDSEKEVGFEVTNQSYPLHHGDIVIAAITSCTNTSNPSVLMAAGLVAKKAVEKGMRCKPWVKSSLAPGSKVVTEYLEKAGLQTYLDELGFNLVGYGCTTCIGNSGPLPEPIAKTIDDNTMIVSSVLSGNRNFEGRIHQQVKANWLASPPLVVAYALAGSTRVNINHEPLGEDKDGKLVFLKDLWPSAQEVSDAVMQVSSDMFNTEYESVFDGDDTWRNMQIPDSLTYEWQEESSYVKHPPFFADITHQAGAMSDVKGARILALFGDTITTDHISPAGAIKKDSPAGTYLTGLGIGEKDFNSYGSRRGNHEVMMRGTFANIRIRNQMVPDVEGGFTKFFPEGDVMSIYDAAMAYQKQQTPLVVIAGKEYGTGSSRDWAAKGTRLLGVKAVIAESYERIHRSNLIGMGVLPLQFMPDQNRTSLALTGNEVIDIQGVENGITPGMTVKAVISRDGGQSDTVELLCRIDTENEAKYCENGGILNYVIRQLA